MKFIILFFCILSANIGLSQSFIVIKGEVYDTDDAPIVNAHISLYGTATGTITNNKGDFYLKIPDKFCDGRLKVSHIEYLPATIDLTCTDNNKIKIRMQDRTVELEEVNVTALSANQIVENSIVNLNKYFQVDSVNYKMFSRYTETSENEPVLIEESVYNLYHESNSKPEFHLIKIRGKGFNEFGQKRFNNTRLIGIHTTESHIMLRYLPDFLNKRKMKKFTYRLVDEIEVGGGIYYVINVSSNNPSRPLKGGTIYINKLDFAITYLTEIYKSDDYYNTYNSYYVKSGNKWYFTHGSIAGWKYYKKEDLKIERNRITVATNRELTRLFKKSEEMGLMVQMLKDFKSDFNDNFWEDYNYIPLDEQFERSLTNAKNP